MAYTKHILRIVKRRRHRLLIFNLCNSELESGSGTTHDFIFDVLIENNKELDGFAI